MTGSRPAISVARVRLASLNLLNGMSLEQRSVDPPLLGQAVVALDADIVGLQEVDRNQPRSHGADLTRQVAAAMGVDEPGHWRFVPALIGTPGGAWRAATDDDDATDEPAYGIGLVSRWPVTSWHVTRLRASPVRSPIMLPGTRKVVWLKDEPRVGLAAVVAAPGGALTVATTHLSFVPVWNGVQLRRFTAALGQLPGPRVLLGDLNMPPPLPRWLSRWRVLARTPTYPVWEPRIQLDHVLGSGELPLVAGVETPQLAISDHRALLVELAGSQSPSAARPASSRATGTRNGEQET